MTGGQKFCLRWDGFKSRLSSVFDELRREEELLDVTLCCDGGHAVKAHQILLSASSPSLRQLLKSNPCQHPVFFLKETSAEDLHAIIQFIYCGEVNVVQSQLASFIKTAEMLQIRGLSGDSDGDEDQTPTATAPRQSSAPPPREAGQPAPAEARPSKRRRRRSSGTSDLSATYDASSSASATASVTASSKTAAGGVPAAASAAATASKSAIPSTSVSTDNRAVANVPKAASASVIAADANVVSLDDIKTEQVDLSDDEGPSMDDPLGFFSSFEGHVDAGSAAGPSSRDSHGGPSTAAGPSGQAGATAAGEPTAQGRAGEVWTARRDATNRPPERGWRLSHRGRPRRVPYSGAPAELDRTIFPGFIRDKLENQMPLERSDWRALTNAIYEHFRDVHVSGSCGWYNKMGLSLVFQFPYLAEGKDVQHFVNVVRMRLLNKFRNGRRKLRNDLVAFSGGPVLTCAGQQELVEYNTNSLEYPGLSFSGWDVNGQQEPGGQTEALPSNTEPESGVGEQATHTDEVPMVDSHAMGSSDTPKQESAEVHTT